MAEGPDDEVADPDRVAEYAARAGHFADVVADLDSVDRVEKAIQHGNHYWKVYPTDPVIPADLAEQLGRHGLNATPDTDGLLVDSGGVVFEGEQVDQIRGAIETVIETRDADALEVSKRAAELVERDDAPALDDIDSVPAALAEMQEVTELVEMLFFDADGEPVIDPDDETVEWVVLPWPHDGIGGTDD